MEGDLGFPQLVDIVTSLVMALAAIIGLISLRLAVRHFRHRALYDALELINGHQVELNRVFSLSSVPYVKWTEEDKRAANVICVDLFHFGGLLKVGILPKEFMELYYYTIPKIWEICSDYIEDMRKTRHPAYWKKFEELVKATKEHNADTEFQVP